MEYPWGKEIQVGSNKVWYSLVGDTGPMGLLFIWRGGDYKLGV